MRTISDDLRNRLISKYQTLYNNANPQMQVILSRQQFAIDDSRYWQSSTVADVACTCSSVAMHKDSNLTMPDTAYVAYVASNTLTVKFARLGYPISNMVWSTHSTISNVIACAIDFDGVYDQDDQGVVQFSTDDLPMLFYVTTGGALMYGILGGPYTQLVASGVTALDAVRGSTSRADAADQGMCLFYISGGTVYYMQYINGAWLPAAAVPLASANAEYVHAERTFDYRIVLQIKTTSSTLYQVFTKMQVSDWVGSYSLEAKVGMTITVNDV